MKKETKKTTKKVTKKPTFIVDLTKAETCEDVKFEFIKAKATQGVAITEDEILYLVSLGATIFMNYMDKCINKIMAEKDLDLQKDINEMMDIILSEEDPTSEQLEKFDFNKDGKINGTDIQARINASRNADKPKKPWYKRFWAWLTKPFRKNK